MSELMRSRQQMGEVYKTLAAEGRAHDPYVLEFSKADQRLVFFGSIHTTDSEDKQWGKFDRGWRDFAKSTRKKVVIHEGIFEDFAAESEADAVTRFGESGKAIWRAKQADIEPLSGEPGRAEEVTYLKQSHSEAEILTYYFARQMDQWAREDYRTNPDWKAYAEHSLAMMDSLGCWDEPLNFERAVSEYEKVTGKAFNIHHRDELYEAAYPYTGSVSEASGEYRDSRLYETIHENWQAGKDIFVIYGSGHAIVLEPALEKLTSEVR